MVRFSNAPRRLTTIESRRSNDTRTMICKFCDKSQSAAYVCPRCRAPYCSVACYKSSEHLQCSEMFYKKCAQEQLKANAPRNCDSEKVKRVLREHLQAKQEEDHLDSEFSARFSNIDITDANSVLEVLTAEERQTFSDLLASERISELIPAWKPWWFERKKLIEEMDVKNIKDSEKGYRPQRKIPRHRLGGRKVLSLDKSSSQRPPSTVESAIATTPDSRKPSVISQRIRSSDAVGENPKRTSIIDPRYKPRKTSPSLAGTTSSAQDAEMAEATPEPLASAPPASVEKILRLDDRIPRGTGSISPLLRARCANMLNLLSSFAFTARYYNGDLKDLAEEAGSTFCSICSLFDQVECHEVPVAICDVLSKPIVAANANRVSLIRDIRQLCTDRAFVRRALMEIGSLLKAFGNCLIDKSDVDAKTQKQRIHKFRYKVHFYIDWIDRSFAEFEQYSMPLVEMFLTENVLSEISGKGLIENKTSAPYHECAPAVELSKLRGPKNTVKK
ncbi:uncharacterized protein LOC100906299 [Galendromus occidentalis]|uniref:Uncharacterized protein LOC100906299 n=1 Tax=Galendromus occidentalis TaxID=34638 RepID=A0AAJ6QRD0_9ACAR|nr:uncharacterized protein LOC100906299 [Galendromus occidentalis]